MKPSDNYLLLVDRPRNILPPPHTEVLMLPNAIPTRYGGVTYRSRLEARWAVCFDCLHIPFQYEPECQFLEEGPYLPDFILWDRLHVEVKPRLDYLDAMWDQYETLLDRVRGMTDLLILTGPPRVQWYPVLTLTPPCTFWIDLERSATKGEPVWLLGARCPPLADLVQPPSRFLAACMTAAQFTFDQEAA